MRAAVWRAVGQPLSLEAVTIARPGPYEVEVEVAACAICHSDLAFMDGDWTARGPIVFGHEAAGRVTAVGAQVSAAAPGDRVSVTLARACGTCPDCARGRPITCATRLPPDPGAVLRAADGEPLGQGLNTAAFAERVLVHESQIVGLPDSLGWAGAAVVSCAVLTGYGAVARTAALGRGETVAVVGIGGVGLNALQAARIAGAGEIVAIDIAPARLAAATRFGATAVIDASAGDPVGQALALTGGRGVDAAILCVNRAPVIEQAVGMLARGGRLVVAGMPPEDARCIFDPCALASRHQSILGSKFGGAVIREDIPRICGLHAAGEFLLDELVTATFPFERINDALDTMRRGEGLRSVVLFDWAREDGR